MIKFSKKYYDLIDQYKIAHKNGIKKNNNLIDGVNTFSGRSLENNLFEIKKIISDTASVDLLDYGCGKAIWYTNTITVNNIEYSGVSNFWNIKEFYLFDPGVDKYSKKPNKKFDGVVCTDVLEHIHPDDIENVVFEIFSFAKKFVFFDIATVEDNKILSNGENAHLIVKPHKWWLDFLKPYHSKNSHLKVVLKT